MAKFKEKFFKAKAALTSLDSQPLAKAAVLIVIFLDVFILVSVFDGLDRHTKQLASQEEYIPQICREIVINQRWNATNQIDNLAQIVSQKDNDYFPQAERKLQHPVCSPITGASDAVKRNEHINAALSSRAKIGQQVGELQQSLNESKGVYDTSLLENISGANPAKVSAIATDFRRKANDLNNLKGTLSAYEKVINEDKTVIALWSALQSTSEASRQQLKDDLRTLNFWYPVKKLGMQLIFLLPLFGVFYAWNNSAIRRGNGLQVLVSAHLLCVTTIPILFKIMETVYYILPKKLLHRLLEELEALKLVAIWNYLVMAIAVGCALFLINVFQKKLFSQGRLVGRRISSGECQACGKKLPVGCGIGIHACPSCGFALFEGCDICGGTRHALGKHCCNCGAGRPAPTS